VRAVLFYHQNGPVEFIDFFRFYYFDAFFYFNFKIDIHNPSYHLRRREALRFSKIAL